MSKNINSNNFLEKAIRLFQKEDFKILLVLAVTIEVGMLTFWRNKLGAYVSPIVLLISQLFIGIAFLKYFHKKKLNSKLEIQRTTGDWLSVL